MVFVDDMLKLDTLATNTKQHIINKTIKISKIFELTSVPLHKTLKTDSTLNGFYRIFFQQIQKRGMPYNACHNRMPNC